VERHKTYGHRPWISAQWRGKDLKGGLGKRKIKIEMEAWLSQESRDFDLILANKSVSTLNRLVDERPSYS
jgi:hypothetical protein